MFLERLERYLNEQQAAAVVNFPATAIRPMIRAGVARARGHGILSQAGIAMFVGLMFRIAPNFDEYPPIRAQLLKQEGTPDERILGLVDGVRAKHWKGALRRYDMRCWGLPGEQA